MVCDLSSYYSFDYFIDLSNISFLVLYLMYQIISYFMLDAMKAGASWFGVNAKDIFTKS